MTKRWSDQQSVAPVTASRWVRADSGQTLRPAPEVVLLIDGRGRIVRWTDKYSGERLKSIKFTTRRTLHEVLHPACDGSDCDLQANWIQAWNEHANGLPVEWFFVSRASDVALRLRLQPVSYACSVLFTEISQDYDDCSVLFVRDVSASAPRGALDRTGTVYMRHASIYQLRRASDPDPTLVATLDDRLRNLTGRLLTSQEAERKRIASELHDSLGQSLSLLKWEIEGCLAREQASGDRGGNLRDLTRACEHARRSLRELREITRHLRPSVINEVGLFGALNLLCSDFRAVKPEIQLSLEVAGCPRNVPAELAVAVYRIAQEALHNVIRHAEASSASVIFAADERRVDLEVRDDGMGFEGCQAGGRGLGLLTIRERAETLGGTYNIETVPGNGCTVRVSWPSEAVNLSR